MSSPSSPTLTIEVHSHRTERAVALFAVGASALAPLLLRPASLPLAALLGVGTGLVIWLGFRHLGWLHSKRQLVRLSWRADGSWLLTDRCSRAIEGTLRGDARAGRHWVWLRWNSTTPRLLRSRTMLLTSADLCEPDLRRLIVRLRLEGAGRNVPAGPAFPA